MKKHLIVIGIVVLLLVVGLSGCIEQIDNDEMEKFIGTWVSTHYVSGTNLTYNYTITFSLDGGYDSDGEIYGGIGKYEVKGEKLILAMSYKPNMVFTFDYYFSSDGQNFAISDEDGYFMRYTKQ